MTIEQLPVGTPSVETDEPVLPEIQHPVGDGSIVEQAKTSPKAIARQQYKSRRKTPGFQAQRMGRQARSGKNRRLEIRTPQVGRASRHWSKAS